MYWGDYARDTGHLNATCHGAYLMLIKHYWCSGAPLTNDDDELWRIACCDSKREWQKIKPKIAKLFSVDGSQLRHKRVDQELAKALANVNAKAEAGKKGAEKRWQKDGSAIAEPQLSQWQNDATSPSPKKEEDSDLRSDASASPPDARALLWSSGLELLGRLTGKPPKACRAVLGKWAKDVRDDCAMLNAILGDCAEVRPGDPIAWVTQGIAARMKPPDKFAWLDEPTAASPHFDLEAFPDVNGTFHPD